MCGIFGISARIDQTKINSISASLIHRGPDSGDFYRSDAMTLVHRRLSIIDLEGGGQPISNADDSLWIVFNGEMFNYREERQGLEEKGYAFKTKSDTEVVLHLYQEYGPGCLQRINGQFALAIWNERSKELFLARDRFGITPLFYTLQGGRLSFSSEIKALLLAPGVEKRLNPAAVSSFFLHHYNTLPESMFAGIYRFPPGCWAIYRQGDAELKPRRYYSISFAETKKIEMGGEDIRAGLLERLERAVQRRLVADVEVGMFLSSGIDSISILSLASRFSEQIKAFCVGFGLGLDETSGAEQAARRYNAQFNNLSLSPGDTDQLAETVRLFDEPVGDSIILPTCLLSRSAARKLKVVLTGEGADEIMGGYIHQMTLFYVQRCLRRLPKSLLRLAAGLLRAVPLPVLSAFFPYPERLEVEDRGKVIGLLKQAHDFSRLRESMVQLYDDHEFAGPGLKTTSDAPIDPGGDQPADFFFTEMDADLTTWLPAYTLYKQDTLSMANSIEGRTPFLDHELVDFLAQIPARDFISQGRVKMPLRRAMAGQLPPETLKASKKAFYFPYQKFFTNFPSFLARAHQRAGKSTELKRLLNLEYFSGLVARFSERSSLIESKRVMAYLIFLVWYDHHSEDIL